LVGGNKRCQERQRRFGHFVPATFYAPAFYAPKVGVEFQEFGGEISGGHSGILRDSS